MIWIWRWLTRDWWVVRRTGFPYPDGYVAYNIRRCTSLDIVLDRGAAQEICDELNWR